MILAGDIGGTKTVLAIFDRRSPIAEGGAPDGFADGAGVLPRGIDRSLAIVREAIYPCADYPSLEAVLAEFLRPEERNRLTGACFGVAGPVYAGTAKITNLPWTIDAAGLANLLGGIPVALLNDLQATALGALVLPDTAFAVLQPAAAAPPGGTIAVIAPGTGLGEALLVSDGTYYRALPSEGGHADFAPGTDDEIALLHYLRGRYGDHVSYERVLSGAGIGDLYHFLRTTTGTAEPAWLSEAFANHDRNAVISRVALEHRDPACVRALEMFTEILGAEAGNLALRGLASGGVVIGGGIPPKILPALTDGHLLDRFNAKGRFAPWTRTLGVRVALEPRAALFGAAHHAATYKDARA
ncbi:MAG TPA: glucokinase [Kofleriaceae bacterium]|nr:glucokinase [Kofleriaceae bacterium]